MGTSDKRHVFQDGDAEVIHEALMVLVSAISDLKELVVLQQRHIATLLDRSDA